MDLPVLLKAWPPSVLIASQSLYCGHHAIPTPLKTDYIHQWNWWTNRGVVLLFLRSYFATPNTLAHRKRWGVWFWTWAKKCHFVANARKELTLHFPLQRFSPHISKGASRADLAYMDTNKPSGIITDWNMTPWHCLWLLHKTSLQKQRCVNASKSLKSSTNWFCLMRWNCSSWLFPFDHSLVPQCQAGHSLLKLNQHCSLQTMQVLIH